jgi:Pentapeptide repeats (8 copies)
VAEHVALRWQKALVKSNQATRTWPDGQFETEIGWIGPAYARFEGARFAKARLAGARFAKARLAGARCARARVERARLAMARVEGLLVDGVADAAELTSSFTMLAFLVVLRVLIRLFFSIDMAGKLLKFF